MSEFIKNYHSLFIFLTISVSSLFLKIDSVIIILSFLYIISEKLLAYLKQPDYSQLIRIESERVSSLINSVDQKLSATISGKDIDLSKIKKDLEELDNRFSSFKNATTIKKDSGSLGNLRF